MNFWNELKRRNVFRVAAAYVVFAWLLVQVTETVLPIFQVPDVFLRGVILLLLIGFPLAIFFAWAFELTPEGVKRERHVSREASLTPQTGRKLDRMIIAVLLLAVGYFLVDEFFLESREAEVSQVALSDMAPARDSEAEGASIAVLPFVNMSDDESNEYFAEGIAEELLTLLARVDDLRVISRSSSFAFKGQNIGMDEIADRLGVAHILDGSVRKAGNQVRVAVRLIDARSDEQRWSESFDRELDNIFAIQDEIASSVVDRLRGTLLESVPAIDPANPEAFDLYLRAREIARNLTEGSLERSNALYRQALEIDPSYAEAWSGLGANYFNLGVYGVMPVDEALSRSREALERALAIDGNQPLVLSRLGGVAVAKKDLTEAAARMQRALKLAPSDPDVVNNAVFGLLSAGRLDQAIRLQRFVTQIDPVSPGSHSNLGLLYSYDEQWESALAAFEVALQLSPDLLRVNFGVGLTLFQQGRFEEARAAFEREPEEALAQWGIAMVAHALEGPEAFKALRLDWIEKWGEDYPEYAAQMNAATGHPDEAFRWLRVAEDQSAFQVGLQFLEHHYDPIRDDPRWQAFLQRMGRTEEQLSAIEFELPESFRD